MTRCLYVLLVSGAALLASGCGINNGLAKSDLFESSDGRAVELTGTPFYPQSTDQCGPAALATVLRTTNVSVVPADLAPRLYLPGRQGSLQIELMAAARGFGRIPYVVEPDAVALLAELQSGRPVLVLQNLGSSLLPVWHFAVVVGYLPEQQAFVLRSGDVRRHLMPVPKFLRSWRRAESWGVVVLAPGEMPSNPDAGTFVRAVADLEAVGQLEAAVTGYRAATEQWPTNTLAWLGLGNAHQQLGQLEMAQMAYSELLKIEPDSAVALNNLALVLADRGHIEDAIQAIDAALSRTQPGDALHGVIVETRSEILDHQTDSPHAQR